MSYFPPPEAEGRVISRVQGASCAFHSWMPERAAAERSLSVSAGDCPVVNWSSECNVFGNRLVKGLRLWIAFFNEI